jgi:hypothetical protein
MVSTGKGGCSAFVRKPKRRRDPNRRTNDLWIWMRAAAYTPSRALRQRVEPCACEHRQHEQCGRPVQANRDAAERSAPGAHWPESVAAFRRNQWPHSRGFRKFSEQMRAGPSRAPLCRCPYH